MTIVPRGAIGSPTSAMRSPIVAIVQRSGAKHRRDRPDVDVMDEISFGHRRRAVVSRWEEDLARLVRFSSWPGP
jgi:hypothetical protein